MKNRLLSVLLCLCMLISLIPAAKAVSAEAGTIRVLGGVSECEHDYTVKVTPPVAIRDVVVKNILGTGVDIVASGELAAK